MSSSQVSVFSTNVKCLNLYVNIFEDNLNIGGNLSKEDLSILLKNKLLKGIEYASFKDYNKTLNTLTSQGIYSEVVISKLLKNGLSKVNIIKAMKRGLLNLQPNDLCSFNIFNVSSDVINYPNLETIIDRELFAKLINVGLNEVDCLNIVLQGLINQSNCCIFRLMINNITAMKILNWQGPILCASLEIIHFLKKLGIDDNTIEIISQYGISEEAFEVLNDLGFSKFNEKECSESSKFTCNLLVEENEHCLMTPTDSLIKKDSLIKNFVDVEKLDDSRQEIILEKANYLRQNLIAPLTWAISRALRYNPTDFIHYIACQLIRWKYYLILDEKNKIIDYVNKATIKKDKFFKKSLDETNSIQSSKLSCQCCLNAMELHRLKGCCWKCKRKRKSEN